MNTFLGLVTVKYNKAMPRGVYERSEAQLQGMRERFRAQGARTRPSNDARSRMSAERAQHGHSKRGATSKTYQCWRNMLNRCNNPNVPAYKNYGGRGITVCKRWSSFDNFLADMGEQPQGMTIDRINNDGNYEPGNCRWASARQQGRNTRQNRLITLNGETKSITEWAEEIGIKMPTIWARLRMGWTAEESLTTPVRRRR